MNGLALFERVGRMFRRVNEPPGWMRRILPPRRVLSPEELSRHLAFFESFLPYAEAVWRSQGEEAERSNWIVADEAGVEFEIEAVALSAGGRAFFTLASRPQEYAERRQILQQARLLKLAAERQSRDIEKKDVLLHAIVHDLMAPLGVITGTLATLAEDIVDVNKRHMCHIALMQCRRQEQMIRDMLDVYAADLARLDAFTTDPSAAPDIGRVIGDVADSLAATFSAKNVTLQVDGGATAPGTLVAGEPSRLERVFANLIENAFRYTPRGGTVSVRLRPHDGSIFAEVHDQGPGIAADLLPRLFQKFSQGREKTGKIGLGLFFCRITVERWGGAIGAENSPEGGAVFWFRLPIVKVPEAHGKDLAH